MNKITKPTFPKTIAQADMRKINRSAVLELLRLSGPASRSEIADQLGLSRPSIKRIIDQLMEENFVIPSGKKVIEKGRALELLSLNFTENVIICIDIGGNHIRGALINIGGEIIIDQIKKLTWTEADENFLTIHHFITSLLEKSRHLKSHLLGIGIGIPGIINPSDGSVKIAPSLNWENYPFLEKIQSLYQIPIYIENDVALATLGEFWFGAGVGMSNLVMIAIGTGIGSGIIIDKKLYHGHSNAAGEIGYFLPGLSHLENTYPGFGALESLTSGKGIAERYKEIISKNYKNNTPIEINALTVIEKAKAGEVWAKELINETINYYSLMIANVSLCFDPEIIIIGGGLDQSFDYLFKPITARLEGKIPRIPPLKRAALSNDAPLLGAVTHVFQKVTDYTVIQIA